MSTINPLAELRPILNGYHVKTLRPDVCVHVNLRVYNWRLQRWHGPCDTPAAGGGPYWCYQDRGTETLLLALAEAIRWDGTEEHPPEGWIKSYTGERREATGESPPKDSQHDRDVPV